MDPLASWPLGALVLCSVVVGVLMAIGFRFTSNQQAIRRAADGCRAQVLAIKLFQDDLVGILHSCGRLLRHTGARLGHSVPPMLVMIVPLAFLFSQLAMWYEHAPLVPGEATVVQLQSDSRAWSFVQQAALVETTALEVEAGPLRDLGRESLYWRIKPGGDSSSLEEPGSLRWEIGKQVVEKRIVISDDMQRLQPINIRRPGPGWWDQFLYPGEPGLPRGGALRGIEVDYPRRQTPIFGLNVPWWATFLIVSMLSALAVKPLVGVSF